MARGTRGFPVRLGLDDQQQRPGFGMPGATYSRNIGGQEAAGWLGQQWTPPAGTQMVDRSPGFRPGVAQALPDYGGGAGSMVALGAPSRGMMMGGRLPVGGAVQGQHMAPQAAQVRPRLGANDIPAGSKDWMPLAPPGPGEPPRIPFFRTWGGNLTQGEIDEFWGNPKAPFPPGYGPQAPLYPQAAPPAAAPPAAQGARPYSPAPQIGSAPGGGGGYAAAGAGSSLAPQGGPFSNGANSVGMAGTPEGAAFDRIRSFRERWGQTYTPQPRQVPTYDQALAEAQGIRTPLEQANADLNARNQYSSDQNYAQGMRPIYGGQTSNEIMGEANRMYSPAIGYPDRNNVQPVDGRYAVNPQGRYASGGQYALPGQMSTIDRNATRQSLPPTAADERNFPAPRPGFYGTVVPGTTTVVNAPSSMPAPMSEAGRLRYAQNRAKSLGVPFIVGDSRENINRTIEQTQVDRAAAGRQRQLQRRGVTPQQQGTANGGPGAFGYANPGTVASQAGPRKSPLQVTAPDGTVSYNRNFEDVNNPMSVAVAEGMENPALKNNPTMFRRYLQQRGFSPVDIDQYIESVRGGYSGWNSVFNRGAVRRWERERPFFGIAE